MGRGKKRSENRGGKKKEGGDLICIEKENTCIRTGPTVPGSFKFLQGQRELSPKKEPTKKKACLKQGLVGKRIPRYPLKMGVSIVDPSL